MPRKWTGLDYTETTAEDLCFAIPQEGKICPNTKTFTTCFPVITWTCIEYHLHCEVLLHLSCLSWATFTDMVSEWLWPCSGKSSSITTDVYCLSVVLKNSKLKRIKWLSPVGCCTYDSRICQNNRVVQFLNHHWRCEKNLKLHTIVLLLFPLCMLGRSAHELKICSYFGS